MGGSRQASLTGDIQSKISTHAQEGAKTVAVLFVHFGIKDRPIPAGFPCSVRCHRLRPLPSCGPPGLPLSEGRCRRAFNHSARWAPVASVLIHAEGARGLNYHRPNFNSHSFWIGAATTAGVAGVPEATIKVLGRRKSGAYQQYIRPSAGDLAQVQGVIYI